MNQAVEAGTKNGGSCGKLEDICDTGILIPNIKALLPYSLIYKWTQDASVC